MSSKNIKIGAQKNMKTANNSLRRSISPFIGVKTYKQDAIKLLTKTLQHKLRGYFELLRTTIVPQHKFGTFKKPEFDNEGRRMIKCSKKSISSLKKAIGYCKDIESSFERIKNTSPNTSRIKRSNELRRSIQALGSKNNNTSIDYRNFNDFYLFLDRLNRSTSNFDISHKRNTSEFNDDDFPQSRNNFIIQPEIDSKLKLLHTIGTKRHFVNRRNSGWINNQSSYIELSSKTQDNLIPVATLRTVSY